MRTFARVRVQVVASAIVDKYIGESARVIREMFAYAREHQPCVAAARRIRAAVARLPRRPVGIACARGHLCRG